MRRALLCLVIPLALAACDAATPASFNPGEAAVPPDVFGAGNQDVAAANLAQFSFADTSRIYGKPADAARSAAAIEYLADELQAGVRLTNVPGDARQQMIEARAEVRKAIGISPDSNGQATVNALLIVAGAIDARDEAGLRTALQSPVFTLLPAQTMLRLGDITYMQAVDLATDRVADLMASLPSPQCTDCNQFYRPAL